jgi:fructan beta-fructosidase
VRLEVYVDSTSVEVFAGQGEVVVTDQIFPSPDSDGLAVFAEGGTALLRSVAVIPMA